MRIRLKNFRCYDDETFDFGSDGIALLSGPSGQGKCLAKNTEILMYNGEICMSQNIQIGDLIMGPDSQPRRVISTCSGMDKLFTVTPLMGQSHTINSHHILTLYYNGQLVDIPLLEYQKLDWLLRCQYQIAHMSVDFPEQPTNADPYGVGTQIAEKIPDRFKINSRRVRTQILQGIIDSYAINQNDTFVIYHKNQEFIKDISFISNSLGSFSITRKIPGQNIWSVIIYKNSQYNIQPFSISQAGVGEYYGFELDGDGRFLLGDFTVTHNSSILMGIYFALNGSGTKVVAHGKTSCLVEFEFDGMKITRTKRPNRLVVNDVYEDQAAQEIINKKFGDAFDVSGYIAQNAVNSFILMSPIEKLSFLEKFAFREINLGEIKGRCKAHISKTHDELVSSSSNLRMAQAVLDEMVVPIEVKFPLSGKSNKELAIKNENTRYKNAIVRRKKHEKNKQAIEAEISDFRVLEAHLSGKQESMEKIRSELKTVELNIATVGSDFNQDLLTNYEKSLNFLLNNRKLSELQHQVEHDKERLLAMKQTEIDEINNKISNIGDVWSEMSKDELIGVIDDAKQCLTDLRRLQVLQRDLPKNIRDISDIERDIEDRSQLYEIARMQQGLYVCPCCSSSLRILDGKLTKEDTTVREQLNPTVIKQELAKLKQELVIAQSGWKIQEEINQILVQYEELPTIEETQESVKYHQNLLDSNLEKERRLVGLERSLSEEKFSSSYHSFAKTLDNLIIRLEKEQKNIDTFIPDTTMSEEELRNHISNQKQLRDQVCSLERRHTQLSQEQKKLDTEISNLQQKHAEKFGSISDISLLQDKIGELDTCIQEETNAITTHEANLKRIEEWERYQKELENYRSWETKITGLEEEEQIAKSKHAAATMLKEKILEAESVAMVNIIDSINMHAHLYLEYFFVDNPIVVRIKPFKETKKGVDNKPQISIDIEYKGMECDLNSLSGGELSRVILAYTLALAEIFNAPLLLLDECTASLDQELTSVVFEAIREHFNGKMTVIIAHQVITGTFDKIIKLGESTD